ncbi:MAG: site-specific integrase [Proteobacteria bacterium]|nr:site-specific integrase [Pseudomonadota bacterium]
MSTITRRGESQWQAKVRRKGFPAQTRTFLYKEDAERWARATERELETSGFIDRRKAESLSFADVLRDYQKDVTPNKKSAVMESEKIDLFLKDATLPSLSMAHLSSAEIAAWRDRRLKKVSGATVNRELTILSSIVNHVRRERGLHVENPVSMVKRPPAGRARDRRLSAEEEAYLFAALGKAPRRGDGTFGDGARNAYLAPIFKLALETAMRRGELLSLQWECIDLEGRTAHLADTKNGDARTVPLSTRAVAVFKALPKPHKGQVFPMSPVALRKAFGRGLERARQSYAADCAAQGRDADATFLQDVHFHDTRHEAASRLAEKLSNVLELSAVTGHRDLRMLKRYYHPRPEDLAKKLG